MDRMGATLQADPMAANWGVKAPETPPAASQPQTATQTPVKAPDAPTGTETAKETPPVKEAPAAEVKTKASDLLKQLASGEKKADAIPPTPEQKKEYSMKELRLRAEKADSLEKELADARKDIETAKAAGATPDEIKVLREERDAIKAERDAYEKKIAALDVMQSKEYIENVTKPMEEIWKDLNKSAEDFKFSMRDLSEAIQIPDHRQRLAAISKVLDSAEGDLDPLNRHDLVSAANEFLRRSFLGQKIAQDSTEAKKALDAEKTRKESEDKQTRSQTFKSHADDVFNQMFSEESLSDMPYLASKDEDGKLTPKKELLNEIKASAKDEEDAPYMRALKSYSLTLLPTVMEHAKAQEAKIAELEERVAKLSGAGPRPGGTITHEESGDPDSKLGFQERIEKQLKAEGRLV